VRLCMARGAHLAANIVHRRWVDGSGCWRVCGRRRSWCDETRGGRWRWSLMCAKHTIQPEATKHECHAPGKPCAIACQQAQNGRSLPCPGGRRRYRTLGAVRTVALLSAHSSIRDTLTTERGCTAPLSRPKPSLLERWLGVKHGHTWTQSTAPVLAPAGTVG